MHEKHVIYLSLAVLAYFFLFMKKPAPADQKPAPDGVTPQDTPESSGALKPTNPGLGLVTSFPSLTNEVTTPRFIL